MTGTFKQNHLLLYGLSCNRTVTGVITSVTCRFCSSFGREESVGSKRKKSDCVKSYGKFTDQSTQYYKQHLSVSHPTKWSKYQGLNTDEKKSFFDVQIKYGETMLSHAEDNENVILKFLKPIIDNIISEFLLDEQNDPAYKAKTLAWFKKPFSEDEENFYSVTISNNKQFEYAIQSVAAGISFRQVSKMVTITKRLLNVGQLGALNIEKVSLYVRSATALNLTALYYLLEKNWAFSIAFDCSKNQATTFCDIRFRFYFDGDIHDFHVILLPIEGSETGESKYFLHFFFSLLLLFFFF